MKKRVILVALMLMLVFGLVSCINEGPNPDGTTLPTDQTTPSDTQGTTAPDVQTTTEPSDTTTLPGDLTTTIPDDGQTTTAPDDTQTTTIPDDGQTTTAETPITPEDPEIPVTPGKAPGLNMISSMSTPLDFEKNYVILNLFKGNPAEIASNPAANSVNPSSKVISQKITATADAFPLLNFDAGGVDVKRPVLVSFKYLKSYIPAANEACLSEGNFWIIKNSQSGKQVASGGDFVLDGWKQFSQMLDFSKADGTNIWQIGLLAKAKNNPGVTVFNYDDIMFVPSYAITYNANDGTDTVIDTKYFLLDTDGKTILTSYSPDLTVKPSERAGYKFLGWSLKNDATAADAPSNIALENKDLVLYAVWEKDAINEAPINPGKAPGLNIINSKAYPFGFEGDYSGFTDLVKGNPVEIVSNPAADGVNGSAHVLSQSIVAANDAFPVINYDAKGLDTKRPIYVSFKYLKTYVPAASEAGVVEGNLWIIKNSQSGKQVASEGNFDLNGWKQFSKLLDFSKADGTNIWQIGLLAKVKGNAGTTVFNYDDLMFVPSYAITYNANDGADTVVKTAYFLLAENGTTILTSYSPDLTVKPAAREGYKFLGWSLKKDSKTADAPASIALANEDITLYAVWEKDENPLIPIKNSKAPGLNMISSLGYPMDFEKNYDVLKFFKGNESKIVKNPKSDAVNSSEFVLSQEIQAASDAYPLLNFEAGGIDVKRPVLISFKYLKTYSPYAEESGAVAGNLWVIKNSQSGKQVSSVGNFDLVGWKQFSQMLDFSKADGTNIWQIGILAKVLGNSGKTVLNYDDIMFVPSYMIKYLSNDGTDTVVDTKYFLLDTDGKTILTSYSPDLEVKPAARDGYKFLGWSLKKDSKTADAPASIALANEDITLYAVWGIDEGSSTVVLSGVGIDKSGTAITEDGGTITLTPYLLYSDNSKTTKGSFVTDSVNGVLKKNLDGTYTLTGKLNGEITVKAYFEETDMTAELTIAISGQRNDRTATTKLKLMTFGNSIMYHAPAAELGWSGSWGMAASSEDKDYIHRLIHYINEKFGAETVEYRRGGGNISVFERAFAKNDTNYDYSEYITEFVNYAKEFKPDIITVQLGENVNTAPTSASFAHAVTQFVNKLKEAAPDATIIVCTSFWGGEDKINGMTQAAETLGLNLAELHTLNNDANKAIGQFDNYSVATHPSDVGMDNIAKLIYAEINKILSESEVTVYNN